jgi:hypothetical protein
MLYLFNDDFAVEHIHPTGPLVFACFTSVNRDRLRLILWEFLVDSKIAENDVIQTT